MTTATEDRIAELVAELARVEELARVGGIIKERPLTQEERSWESLIAEQGSEVQPDHHLKPGDILSGQGDGLAPMKVSDLRYKGYVQVWDTETGDMSLQPWWLLWQTMRRLTDSGRPKYTRTDPHIAPDYGEDLFCPLNPNAPSEERFSGRGFRVCKKRHIPHRDALDLHVKNKHNRAYLAMARAREDRRRDEDRAMQREGIEAQREAMKAMTRVLERRPDTMTSGTDTVSTASVAMPSSVTVSGFAERVPAADTRPHSSRRVKAPQNGPFICAECNREFTGKRPAWALHMHRKAKHRE